MPRQISPINSLISILLSILILAPVARGAPTDIANAPMAVQNMAKSNVMFTIDSSGGMDVEVLIASFNSMYYESNISGTSAYNTNGFFYMLPIPRPAFLASLYLGFDNNPDQNAWRARYYGYNPQYYNPYITYQPWLGKDNTGAAFANANPTAARLDPYNPAAGSMNLTSTTAFTAYSYLSNATACYPASDARTPKCQCIDPACVSVQAYASSMYPASYYTWNDANSNGVMDAGEGVLYNIAPATAVYPSGRTYAQELQNFANWFQYYRTVLHSLKSAMGQSLAIMGAAKVGMTDLEHATPTSPVADMSVPANLVALYNRVYGVAANLNDWRQPIHERIYNIWNYFNTPPGSADPPAPIKYACEQNFNILVSPGYLNENGPGASGYTNYFTGVTPPPISPANYDGTASALSWESSPKQTWGTAPYADGWGSTLADYAAYYYDKPLRTDLPPGRVPIPPKTKETNPNLHVTTYALAPGAIPLLSSQNPAPSPLANAQSVNVYPPYAPPPASPPPGGYGTSPNWPQPCFVCQSTIDDMWHAAIDGRGIFINSSNVGSGLATIVDNILSRLGASAAVAVNNANVTKSNNVSYSSSYVSGSWVGDLQSYPLDLTTGQQLVAQPLWSPSAQGQIDASSPAGRAIGTYSGTAGIGFNWASLPAAMQTLLSSPVSPPGLADGAGVLSFLRGDRSSEGSLYRTRSHLLGDIINAEPVVVLGPSNAYTDTGYQTFASSNSARTGMVYQGANDGMLHAFNSATGAEAWAYLPGLLFNSRLTGFPNTSVLNNLSSLNAFTHLYYVDGTPVAGDVDFGSPAGSWHTILAGGLAGGGRGYYALDVTNPAASNDAAVAAKVLWEFPNSSTPAATAANIGLSFGKPVIVKTAAAGWVVLVTSGHNNGSNTGGDGQGHLFVLNPATGALLKDIPTGAGNSATPSGLAQISAYVIDANTNNTAQWVYGGDLQGNVWRFDLTAASINGWSVTKLATLVDAGNNPQPVTTAPELGLVGGKLLVFVGTGQYLGNSDVPGLPGSNANSTQTQTMYGLFDNFSVAPLVSPLRTSLVQQTVTTTGSTRQISANTVNFSQKRGWYVDLPSSGERSNTDPVLAAGVLTFTTNIPSTDPCSPGGSSWQYFVDYTTGGMIPGLSAGSAGIFLGNTLASRPILVKLPSGKIVSITRQSDATTVSTQVPTPSASPNGKRVLWRELITQ